MISKPGFDSWRKENKKKTTMATASLEDAWMYLEILQKELLKINSEYIMTHLTSLSPAGLVVVFVLITVAIVLPLIIYVVRMFRPGAGKGIESKMKAVKEFVAPGDLLCFGVSLQFELFFWLFLI